MGKEGGKISRKVLTIPFLILLAHNVFVGVVGGTWLLCLGHWPVVLGGLVISLSMPWWWCVVSIPSKGLLAISGFYEEKGDKAGTMLFRLFSGLYDTLMLIGWVLFVFILGSSISYAFPMLLFSYAVAITPLLYMVGKGSYYNSNVSIVLMVFILIFILCIFGIAVSPFIILVGLVLLRTILTNR